MIAFWSNAFLHSSEIIPQLNVDTIMPLYSPFYKIILWSPIISQLLAILFALLVIFMVIKLNDKYNFIGTKNVIPAYLFVFAIGGLDKLHYLSPMYITSIMSVVIIDKLLASDETKPSYSNIFDIGFLSALTSLFYLNNIFFLPIMLVLFRLVHSNVEWRHVVLLLIGFLLPWLFVYTYYFFTNQTQLLQLILESNFNILGSKITNNTTSLYYFLSILGLTAIGMISRIDIRGNAHRSVFQILFLITITSSAILFLLPNSSEEMIINIIIAFAIIFTNYLNNITRKFWAGLFIITILVAAIYHALYNLM